MDNLLVIGEGVGVDKDIVHIAYGLAIVDEILEDIIHHHLEHCRGVTQSEEHDSWLKQSSVSWNTAFHSSPSLIHMLLNPHQRLSTVKNLVSQRQVRTLEMRELVGGHDCDLFQLLIVLYEAKQPILLLDEEHR